MFGELGLRGVSIIFSSGDSGVGDGCVSNDGQNRTTFQPKFPAACPWVTAVGGTTGINPERAIDFSGGGFSNLYKRPPWQAHAVRTYLDRLGSPTGLFNRTGRGFPDVAGQAAGYLVYDRGTPKSTSGTSASAPVFAALVALLNDARFAKGLPALGWLNPWLYQTAAGAFNDITSGRSIGCAGLSGSGMPDGSPIVPDAGFNATEGWDAVTGLGTPDFGKLLELAVTGVSNEGGPVL